MSLDPRRGLTVCLIAALAVLAIPPVGAQTSSRARFT